MQVERLQSPPASLDSRKDGRHYRESRAVLWELATTSYNSTSVIRVRCITSDPSAGACPMPALPLPAPAQQPSAAAQQLRGRRLDGEVPQRAERTTATVGTNLLSSAQITSQPTNKDRRVEKIQHGR